MEKVYERNFTKKLKKNSNTSFCIIIDINIYICNCSCTIFLAQTRLIRPRSKALLTINIRRGWVKELSLSESIRSDTWIALLQENQKTRMNFLRIFLFLQFLIQSFSVPFFEGLHYIIQFPFSHLSLTLVDHLNIYLSACPIRRLHLSPCELQRPRRYCSGVISSLMRPRGWLGCN